MDSYNFSEEEDSLSEPLSGLESSYLANDHGVSHRLVDRIATESEESQRSAQNGYSSEEDSNCDSLYPFGDVSRTPEGSLLSVGISDRNRFHNGSSTPRIPFGIETVINGGSLLLFREVFGSYSPFTKRVPANRSRQQWGTRKRVRLLDIVEDRTKMLKAGHIFVGFTQDGKFLLSYSATSHRNWLYPLGIGLFPDDEIQGDGCTLHFWKFEPFSGMTKIVRSVNLFAECQNVPSSPKLHIVQWPGNDQQLVALGQWDVSEARTAFGDRAVERQISISIISLPKNVHETKSPHCDIHTQTWLTEAPNPLFHPEHCMLIPNLLIVHGGGHLIMYRILDEAFSFQQQKSKRSSSRKRKHPDDVYAFPSDNLNINEIDASDCFMMEIFYKNGSSKIVNQEGIEIYSHPLKGLFPNLGSPVFSSADNDDYDLGILVTTFRIDILMEKAWEFFKNLITIGSVFRKDCVSSTHFLDELREELILEACYFATIIQPSCGKEKRIIHNMLFPFFIKIDCKTANCTLQYDGSRILQDDKPWKKNELQMRKIMTETLNGICFKYPKKSLTTAHFANNFNVESGLSKNHLLSPDGSVMVTL